MKMLSNMLVLCTVRLSDKFDKGGKPYILHCLEVMHKLMREYGDDEELLCIGLGHDLVEDTDVTYSELRALGYSERVIDGIRCMTKVKGETTEEYVIKIKSNLDAVKTKICDLEHNSDIRRMKGLTEKDFARLKKYQTMYSELKSFLAGNH